MGVEVCSSSGGGGGEACLLVAAVTEQGDALVWRCTHSAQAGAGPAGSRLIGHQMLQLRGRRCGVRACPPCFRAHHGGGFPVLPC